MIDILTKGGILMIPILFCSVTEIAIVIERLYRFWEIKLHNNNFLNQILDDIEQHRTNEAFKKSQSVSGPIPRVIATGIKAYIRYRQEHYVENAIIRAGALELSLLEHNLRGLNVIANVAPLLGLLGTVMGMIKAFMQIQLHDGIVDAANLAGGIWEAMITTAAGLTVAIPSLLFYNYFMGRINSLERAMKDAAVELIEVIREKSGDGV
jgi:biopolymer transport protein ExbB